MAKISMDRDVDDIKIDPKTYPPNNNGDIPKVEAEIITPRAKRFKPEQHKILSAIISSEITDMRHFLIYDTLIPFAKDAFMNMLSMMLFNKPWNGYSGKSNGGPRTYTGSTYWNPPQPGRASARDISKDFTFETKQEAIDVMNSLGEWSNRVAVTTIADFCRIAGLNPDPGDTDYGWYNLRGMRVQSYGNSFYIELPRARLLS